MTLYYLLGRFLSPFAKIAFYVYSVTTGTKRVRTVVRNSNGEVLLMKSWLGASKWELPGGGVERGEPLAAAAIRELREETGLILDEADLEELFMLRSMGHDEVIFMTKIEKADLPESPPRRLEVKEAKWMATEGLCDLDSLAERVLTKIDLEH